MVILDATDQAILLSLNYLQGKFSKKYSYISLDKLLIILRQYHGVFICLRTLNYHLAKLKKLKYIYRQRRDPLDICGLQIYRSSLTTLTDKAFRWLAGVMGCLKRGYYSFKKHLQKSFISSRKELYETRRYFSADRKIKRRGKSMSEARLREIMGREV